MEFEFHFTYNQLLVPDNIGLDTKINPLALFVKKLYQIIVFFQNGGHYSRWPPWDLIDFIQMSPDE